MSLPGIQSIFSPLPNPLPPGERGFSGEGEEILRGVSTLAMLPMGVKFVAEGVEDLGRYLKYTPPCWSVSLQKSPIVRLARPMAFLALPMVGMDMAGALLRQYQGKGLPTDQTIFLGGLLTILNFALWKANPSVALTLGLTGLAVDSYGLYISHQEGVSKGELLFQAAMLTLFNFDRQGRQLIKQGLAPNFELAFLEPAGGAFGFTIPTIIKKPAIQPTVFMSQATHSEGGGLPQDPAFDPTSIDHRFDPELMGVKDVWGDKTVKKTFARLKKGDGLDEKLDWRRSAAQSDVGDASVPGTPIRLYRKGFDPVREEQLHREGISERERTAILARLLRKAHKDAGLRDVMVPTVLGRERGNPHYYELDLRSFGYVKLVDLIETPDAYFTVDRGVVMERVQGALHRLNEAGFDQGHSHERNILVHVVCGDVRLIDWNLVRGARFSYDDLSSISQVRPRAYDPIDLSGLRIAGRVLPEQGGLVLNYADLRGHPGFFWESQLRHADIRDTPETTLLHNFKYETVVSPKRIPLVQSLRPSEDYRHPSFEAYFRRPNPAAMYWRYEPYRKVWLVADHDSLSTGILPFILRDAYGVEDFNISFPSHDFIHDFVHDGAVGLTVGINRVLHQVVNLLQTKDRAVIAVNGSSANVGKTYMTGLVTIALKQLGIPTVPITSFTGIRSHGLTQLQLQQTGASTQKGVFVMGDGYDISMRDEDDLARHRAYLDSSLRQAISGMNLGISGVDLWVGVYRHDRPFRRGELPLADVLIQNDRARDKE